MKKVPCVLIGLVGMILVSLWAFTPFAGTSAPVVSNPQPAVLIDCLDPSLEQFVNGWQTEIARRFPTNTVGVLCHGGSFITNQWIVLDNPGSTHALTTVNDLVVTEQNRYPGRTVVLLCCNPTHLQFHGHPGVFYFSGSVWCVPDRATTSITVNLLNTLDWLRPLEIPSLVEAPNRSVMEPLNCGNIFEAVEAN